MSRFYDNYELNDGEIIKAIRQAADDYENGELLEVADTLAEISFAIKEYSDDDPLIHGQHLVSMATEYGLPHDPAETDRQLKHRILDEMLRREDPSPAQPIKVKEDGTIVSGHARAEMAKRLGMTEVACEMEDGE